ncbi:GIY-YIG nuclease family protein, partial [Bacillus thuringiensis]|nr:GIY-YIG nuclease family protein [Bacillus thuringiensis]
MICIYRLRNKINEKNYIGQTTNFKRRMIRHKADSKHPEPIYKIHRAIKKYGIDNFEITVLEECTEEMLDEREIYWVSHFDSFNNGYNMTGGGNGFGIGEGSPSSRISTLTAKRIIKIKLETVAPYREVANYLNCTLGTFNNVGNNSWQYLNNQIDDFSDEVVEYFRNKYPIDSLNILVFDNRTLELLGEYESTNDIISAGIVEVRGKYDQTSISRAIATKLSFQNKIFIHKKDYSEEYLKEITSNNRQRQIDWIDVYAEDGQYIKRFSSRKEIRDELGLTASQISNGLYLPNQVVTKGFILITNVQHDEGETIEAKLEKLASFSHTSPEFAVIKNGAVLETLRNQQECAKKYNLHQSRNSLILTNGKGT